MYLVGTIGAMGQNTDDKDRAFDTFGDALKLVNVDGYSSQYSYLIHGIGVNSYSFQGSDLMLGNGILGEKKVKS